MFSSWNFGQEILRKYFDLNRPVLYVEKNVATSPQSDFTIEYNLCPKFDPSRVYSALENLSQYHLFFTYLHHHLSNLFKSEWDQSQCRRIVNFFIELIMILSSYC